MYPESFEKYLNFFQKKKKACLPFLWKMTLKMDPAIKHTHAAHKFYL